jgi:CheY-like chemotaxis protein
MKEDDNPFFKSFHHTVLIVDDEKINLELLAGLLESQNFLVERVNSGLKALQFFEKKTADIVLLDIIMPDMDGFEVCKKLKENPGTDNIPVIFITSRADEDTQTKGFEAGCVDFVSKPPSPSIILARIKTHIELKMHRDKLEQLVQKRTAELQNALEQIHTLKGLLPICANCKKIRDDKGTWNRIEMYIQKRSKIEFTHGICPDCAHKLNPELYDK